MLLFCCILFFDPNRIVFVLPKCSDTLLSTNHLWIELSSTVNVVSSSSSSNTGKLLLEGYSQACAANIKSKINRVK